MEVYCCKGLTSYVKWHATRKYFITIKDAYCKSGETTKKNKRSTVNKSRVGIKQNKKTLSKSKGREEKRERETKNRWNK